MVRMFGAMLAAAASVVFAVPAVADPPPTPDPNLPRCLTMGQYPFPHMQYLPCGWDFDGVNWIPPQDVPPPPAP